MFEAPQRMFCTIFAALRSGWPALLKLAWPSLRNSFSVLSDLRKLSGKFEQRAYIACAGSIRHHVPDYIAPLRRAMHGGSLLARQGSREPIKAFIQAIPCGRTCRLNVPLTVTQVVQTQLFRHLSCSHGIGQVLLVCEDKQHSVPHLILVQHLCKLFSGVLRPIAVIAVDHIDETIGALVVVAPERADLVLAANVPDGEAQILVLHSLHVETYGWNGGDHLTKLQLVEDRGLPCRIQADH